MVVGDKNQLALEYVQSEDDKTLGKLFLHVKGIRFGEDGYDFEADDMIVNVITHFKLPETDFNGLIDCPAKELFSSFQMACDEDVGVDEDVDATLMTCEADKYMPHFLESYANLDGLDDCVFRYVDYAFDQCIIILIPSGSKVKLYASDDKSGVCADVLTTEEEFFSLWRQLSEARKNLASH